MHSPRALAALGLSTLLLVSGCNGDADGSEPRETFTPSPHDTSSPSAPESTYTPPEPAKPPKGGWPEDKPATEISAEDVARIWVKAYSKAVQTGDVSRLERLSWRSCDLCSQFVDDLNELYAAGGSIRFRKKSYVAGELTKVQTDFAPLVTIQMVVTASAGTRIPAAGESATPFEAEKYEWFFDLKPRHGRWRVKQMGFVG